MRALFTLIICFFTISAIPTFCTGQASLIPHDLIPREQFFKEKDKYHIQLSQDGEHVFFQKKGVEGSEKFLFFVNAKSPLAERSKEFEGELVDFRPTYNDGIVAIVQQDTNLQVHFTTTRSRSVRQLDVMPFQKMEFLQLSERFPNKILVDITAKKGGRDGIYALDLLSSSMRRLGSMDDFQQLFFDQNFGKVAGLKPSDEGGNVLYRFHEGQWKGTRKYPFHPEMYSGGLSRIISVSSDGKTIYATDNVAKDKASLISIDVATGEVTEVANNPNADLLPYAATVGTDGIPTAVIALRGEVQRQILDESVRPDFEFLEKEMPGEVSFVEASQDGQIWLVRTLTGGPYTYYHYDRTDKKLTELFNDYSYLDEYDLATRKTYQVKVRDGLEFPVNLYVPPGMAKADGTPRVPLPTVVFVHGGPWAGLKYWNSWHVTRHLQLLANRGYAVVQIEFRGTIGLGKEICAAGDKQWGAGMHEDIIDLTDWAIRSGIANPKRIGIFGWSYGGYAVNYAMGKQPELFSCGLSIAGVSDLNEFVLSRNSNRRSWVGDPDTEEGAAVLKAHSPTTVSENIKNPILLSCGSLDDRVPPSQSEDFAKALHDAGKNPVFVSYPAEGHTFEQPESWTSFWAIAEDMLHRHVGGRKQPAGDDISKGNLKVVYGTDYVEGLE